MQRRLCTRTDSMKDRMVASCSLQQMLQEAEMKNLGLRRRLQLVLSPRHPSTCQQGPMMMHRSVHLCFELANASEHASLRSNTF